MRVQVFSTLSIYADDVMITLKWCMNSSQDITWKQTFEYHVNKGFSDVVAWLRGVTAPLLDLLCSGSPQYTTSKPSIIPLMLQPGSQVTACVSCRGRTAATGRAKICAHTKVPDECWSVFFYSVQLKTTRDNILYGCEALVCVNKCLLSVAFILGLWEKQELRREM